MKKSQKKKMRISLGISAMNTLWNSAVIQAKQVKLYVLGVASMYFQEKPITPVEHAASLFIAPATTCPEKSITLQTPATTWSSFSCPPSPAKPVENPALDSHITVEFAFKVTIVYAQFCHFLPPITPIPIS